MSKATLLLSLTFAWACTSLSLADTNTFKNSGLKNEITVTVDVEGKKVNGNFVSAEYGEEAPQRPFSGEIIATPKNRSGVYMRIRFQGDPPYSIPAGAKELVWHLKIVNHRAHLFIPMQERSYEGKLPKWIVSDVELEPVD